MAIWKKAFLCPLNIAFILNGYSKSGYLRGVSQYGWFINPSQFMMFKPKWYVNFVRSPGRTDFEVLSKAHAQARLLLLQGATGVALEEDHLLGPSVALGLGLLGGWRNRERDCRYMEIWKMNENEPQHFIFSFDSIWHLNICQNGDFMENKELMGCVFFFFSKLGIQEQRGSNHWTSCVSQSADTGSTTTRRTVYLGRIGFHAWYLS